MAQLSAAPYGMAIMLVIRSLPVVGLAILAGACGGAPQSAYPSLAIRDVERVSGSLEPPGAAVEAPTPPTPATLDRLDALRAEAIAAHTQFLEAEPETRRIVQAAQGAGPGSDAWARAQIALAELEAARSQTMVPLADLDRLFVDASTSGAATGRITATRSEVDSLVDTENQAIANLRGGSAL